MNYLAHLFLAAPSDEGRIGSLLADFTVGTIDDLRRVYGEPIARSLKHHREIDRYTDTHPAVLHSVGVLGGAYGIYAGIVVDVFFDHFLLKHWERFSRQGTGEFFDSVYRSLDRWDLEFPPRYRLVVGAMIEKRWLVSYQDLENVAFALSKIGERFSRKTPMDGNIAPLREHYDVVEADFLVFFPQLMTFSNQVHRTQGS